MEILSVQNQFQGQFGIKGSNKVKDWTSPLTSPQPSHHRQHNYHRNHYHQNNRHPHSNAHYSSKNVNAAATEVAVKNDQEVDVVDGLTPHHETLATEEQQQQKQQQQLQKHEKYYNYQCNQVIPGQSGNLAKSLSAFGQNNDDDDDTVVDASNIDTSTPLPPHLSRYKSNLICCGGNITGADVDADAAAINELSMRLLGELRAAKSRHLACTEVSLPWDLTPRIAAEVIRLSEKEPCGIRGCTIYIEFEDEPNNSRRIASLKIDPNTVSTFELYLTLRHDKSRWTSLLPQFIKNLTRSSSIIISPDFSLTKNKLYHNSSNFSNFPVENESRKWS